MSNQPPNPFASVPGPPQMSFGSPTNSQPSPNYRIQQTALNQDSNSSSPQHTNNHLHPGQNMNNYNQSPRNSPAFNKPNIMSPSTGIPNSMLPPSKTLPLANLPPHPPASTGPNPQFQSSVPTMHPPQGQQTNVNSQIYNSTSQSQKLSNGPSIPYLPPNSNTNFPPSSRAFSPSTYPQSGANLNSFPNTQSYSVGQQSISGPQFRQQNMNSGPPIPGPPRSIPAVPNPPSINPVSHQNMVGINGNMSIPSTSTPMFPMGPNNTSNPHLVLQSPLNNNTSMPASFGQTSLPSNASPMLGQSALNLQSSPASMPMGRPNGPANLPPQGPPRISHAGPQSLPPTGLQNLLPKGNITGKQHQDVSLANPMNAQFQQNQSLPSAASLGTQGPVKMPQIQPGAMLANMPPAGPQLRQPVSQQPGFNNIQQQGLQSGPLQQQLPPQSNMQNRYPQMPPSNFNQQPMAQMPPQPQPNVPYQYSPQGLTQQMGQLSVTKQGFDQLWGHQSVDLLQCRHILPEYPEEMSEVKLGPPFAESSNCSPEIFRCTINRIPETNSLLQKSRLPLGILIHPFKDLNHLPVIQCTTIVRCRSCRTYINPFVYFVDSKRWKCNLCFRVNDLPEEFQYDPVSKSYGDPSRRPEIKSATIEFIAPGEYMLRPPQPAVYLFLLDISQLARESQYVDVFCSTLKSCLDKLPGDARTQVGFICYDAHVHYYLMSDELTRPKEMTVLDIDEIFLPAPTSLLVNLQERREMIEELLGWLPKRYSAIGPPASALGAALQAAYKLMAPTGGRITVFQTCLPNVGPGALQSREDPNARSAKEVSHLSPATDFYKRLALDCSGAQIAVDLFLLNTQYSDLATLSGMSKFSAGGVYHLPLFKASRGPDCERLRKMLTRYLTRKIGFEAVMRVRCSRGITIHTFHGNFFVRSTDLLSLPNVSPDAGFAMQLSIEESLSDLQHVCFQAALLYTSSKGERRIRVHTLALPVASTLPDILHSADQQCIIGLLSKMAVDRCASSSMSEAREALVTVAVDAAAAYRLAANLPAAAALPAPRELALLPLYLLALLKRKAFRTGISTRLDDRVADMCAMKCLPLGQMMRAVYPDLYALQPLLDWENDDEVVDLPRLQLSAERVNSTGAYLLDDGELMIVYVGHACSPALLSEMFEVTAFSQIPDEARALPRFESDANNLLHLFIDRLNDDRPYPADVLVLRDNSPSRTLFTEKLIEDRFESGFSYYEFLQHIKNQVK